MIALYKIPLSVVVMIVVMVGTVLTIIMIVAAAIQEFILNPDIIVQILSHPYTPLDILFILAMALSLIGFLLIAYTLWKLEKPQFPEGGMPE